MVPRRPPGTQSTLNSLHTQSTYMLPHLDLESLINLLSKSSNRLQAQALVCFFLNYTLFSLSFYTLLHGISTMSAPINDNSASEAYSSDFFSDYESDLDDETVLFCKDEDSVSKNE